MLVALVALAVAGEAVLVVLVAVAVAGTVGVGYTKPSLELMLLSFVFLLLSAVALFASVVLEGGRYTYHSLLSVRPSQRWHL